jgi:hypothetical protein
MRGDGEKKKEMQTERDVAKVVGSVVAIRDFKRAVQISAPTSDVRKSENVKRCEKRADMSRKDEAVLNSE